MTEREVTVEYSVDYSFSCERIEDALVFKAHVDLTPRVPTVAGAREYGKLEVKGSNMSATARFGLLQSLIGDLEVKAVLRMHDLWARSHPHHKPKMVKVDP